MKNTDWLQSAVFEEVKIALRCEQKRIMQLHHRHALYHSFSPRHQSPDLSKSKIYIEGVHNIHIVIILKRRTKTY